MKGIQKYLDAIARLHEEAGRLPTLKEVWIAVGGGSLSTIREAFYVYESSKDEGEGEGKSIFDI